MTVKKTATAFAVNLGIFLYVMLGEKLILKGNILCLPDLHLLNWSVHYSFNVLTFNTGFSTSMSIAMKGYLFVVFNNVNMLESG